MQKLFFPLIAIVESSTYRLGGAYGLARMCLIMVTFSSPLVRATECLQPASMDLETEIGSEQYPLHCIILVALCCCRVINRSTIGKLAKRHCVINTSKSMVSKNFSKSFKAIITSSSKVAPTSAKTDLSAAANMADNVET